MQLHVMLVDDHAVVRTGYRRLIDAEPDLRVVAEATCTEEACSALRSTHVDLAVVDISLRQGSGLDTIRRLLERQQDIRVLVFSMHEHRSYVVQALRNGAHGYLTKHSEPAEMIQAIRKLARGQQVFSPEIAQSLALQLVQGHSELGCLTPREFEVLRMTAKGEPPVSVANQLHLSPKTVLNHLTAIRQKLAVESDLALFRLAAHHGLVELHQAA